MVKIEEKVPAKLGLVGLKPLQPFVPSSLQVIRDVHHSRPTAANNEYEIPEMHKLNPSVARLNCHHFGALNLQSRCK